MIDLLEYGWSEYFQKYYDELGTSNLIPARIFTQNKDIYLIQTKYGEMTAHISGKFRYYCDKNNILLAVGDWVCVDAIIEDKTATIQNILPRKTKLSRVISTLSEEEQVLAANIDYIFIVISLNKDYNVRRIEKYLVLALESGARPMIILSKSDLCEDIPNKVKEVQSIAGDVTVYVISSIHRNGLIQLSPYLSYGKTIVVLGASGVGKSTMINTIAGKELLNVAEIRTSDDQGRHTTTHRELIMLPSQGMIIDTPGIREIGNLNSKDSINDVFIDIESLAIGCKFYDCSHTVEPGCAVLLAVKEKKLSKNRLQNYINIKFNMKEIKSEKVKKSKQKGRLSDKNSMKKIYKENTNSRKTIY